MSTHIVDRIEAIRFTAAAIGHYEDIYLLMELGGDNNVTDERGRRARSWSATCIGPEWGVIGDCCRFASGCSGGMTKLRGRATTPEAYIRAYRKAIKAAKGLSETATEKHIHLTGRIRFARDDKTAAYYLKEAVKGGKTPRESDYFGTKMDVVEFNLADTADLTLWNKCRHGAGGTTVKSVDRNKDDSYEKRTMGLYAIRLGGPGRLQGIRRIACQRTGLRAGNRLP